MNHRLMTRIRRISTGSMALALAVHAVAAPARLGAQAAADSTTRLAVGGFVDLYYAYDGGRPRSLDRAYVTTAARHNEFNVNLAFLEATYASPRVRGRFAVQFGTSVQANYAGEPRLGSLSGADVSRFIQEATVGLKVHPDVWIDAGVFFAPFGAESWISRDNLTYTRSWIADYSPYYESGVRVSWQATPTLQAQFHVINGWQNISETNSDKAVAVRLDWQATPRVTLTYDAFFGNEQPDSLPSRLRQFHEGIVQWTASDALTIRASLDVGNEQRAVGSQDWWGAALIGRYAISPTLAVVGRVEHYADPGLVLVTAAPAPVRTTGASLGLDLVPAPKVVWRSELRVMRASNAIFPDRDSAGGLAARNVAIVTSLGWSF
jgi:hypothetical protein